jgi:hypothetical protein
MNSSESRQARTANEICDWLSSPGLQTPNRQHPYVEVVNSDIIESGEAIDQRELVRATCL